MKLHEAIEKVLIQIGHSLTTTEIANELNKNNWYQKKDGSLITSYQIHGRTQNYSHLFSRSGSTVSLIGQPTVKRILTKSKHTDKQHNTSLRPSIDVNFIEKELLNEKNFKSAGAIDSLVPNSPGIYCIRIIDNSRLPEPCFNKLAERKHNIIYIGIATQNLRRRLLNQELRAKGHGTFFRSIGAVLGFRPEKGTLNNKANKRNYKFSAVDELEIIEWINDNLTVNWLEFNGDLHSLEASIIQKHLPLLNIAKHPEALQHLIELRAECVRIANS